jgi:hypothetical protein
MRRLWQLWLYLRLQPQFWGMAGCYAEIRRSCKMLEPR